LDDFQRSRRAVEVELRSAQNDSASYDSCT
jgi:hypothetical protein